MHVTRDGGGSWKNVTPPDMPDFGRVSLIDASALMRARRTCRRACRCWTTSGRMWWKTEDYGETWTRIVERDA